MASARSQLNFASEPVQVMNAASAGFDPARGLPQGFIEFLLPFHRAFIPRQRDLVGRPSREYAELNARALAALEKDKKNEVMCLMDGAWTGHPDQNEIAFPAPNQLHARPANHDAHPGNLVVHTPELVTRLFDEELARIVQELPPNTPAETIERFTQARVLSERMITTNEFNPS
jgi:malate synthase